MDELHKQLDLVVVKLQDQNNKINMLEEVINIQNHMIPQAVRKKKFQIWNKKQGKKRDSMMDAFPQMAEYLFGDWCRKKDWEMMKETFKHLEGVN